MKSLRILLFIFLLFGNSYETDDDTGTASWTPTKETKSTLLGGIEYNFVQGISKHQGKSDGNQNINIFTLPISQMGPNKGKLVTWAKQKDSYFYQRLPLTKIAEDYERTHPGWKVVCGINADQYFPKYGSQKGVDGSYYYVPQPYYPLIIDGERRFSITPYAQTTNFVGFSNDGTQNSFIYPDGKIKYFGILAANGKILTVGSFNTLNNPTDNTIWTVYISTAENKQILPTVKIMHNRKLYIIEKPSFSYMYNSKAYPDGGVDGFFGKGIITNILEGGDSYTLKSNEFAIESASTDFNINDNIIVQPYYEIDSLNNIIAGSGYHTIQRLNGKDLDNSGSYNTNRYNRSLFGKKSDGSYVLIAADKGSGFSGIDFKETNALLKHYGVDDCFQDDGGGSVTSIIRNSAGGFDVTNHPSDGDQRYVLSALFFVVKD